MSGFIKVNRSVWDHPVFKSGVMTQREAWLWMIAEAAWKPRTVRRGNDVIELERGQLAHSVRFMSEAWGWSKSAGHRFLKTLEKWDMVGTQSGTAATIITICNYDAYQGEGEGAGTRVEREPEDERDTSGTNKKKDKKLKEENTRERFEIFWKAYPSAPNSSKAKALARFEKLSEKDQEAAIAAVPAYVGYLESEKWQKPAHAATWLNQKRWETTDTSYAKPTRARVPVSREESLRLDLVAYRDRGLWREGPEPLHNGERNEAFELVHGGPWVWKIVDEILGEEDAPLLAGAGR